MSFKRLKNTTKEERVSSKVEFEDVPIQLEDMATTPGEFKVSKIFKITIELHLRPPAMTDEFCRASFARKIIY